MEQPDFTPRPGQYLYHMSIGFVGMLFAPGDLRGVFIAITIVALIFWLFSLWNYWDKYSQ